MIVGGIVTIAITIGVMLARMMGKILHTDEVFGITGRGAPESLCLTRIARKSVNGPISSPTLAFSSVSM
jgi:hypothetical protein